MTELSEALRDFTEDKFCTQAYARSADGRSIAATSQDAVKFCVAGWLCRDGTAEHASGLYQQAFSVARALGYDCVSEANDTLGYRFVEILRNYEFEHLRPRMSSRACMAVSAMLRRRSRQKGTAMADGD